MFSPSIDSKTFDWIPFHHTGDINYVALLHCPHVLQKLTGGEQRHYTYITRILQKTAFSLVKSRLPLHRINLLVGCSFVCLFVTMQKIDKHTEKCLFNAP